MAARKPPADMAGVAPDDAANGKVDMVRFDPESKPSRMRPSFLMGKFGGKSSAKSNAMSKLDEVRSGSTGNKVQPLASQAVDKAAARSTNTIKMNLAETQAGLTKDEEAHARAMNNKKRATMLQLHNTLHRRRSNHDEETKPQEINELSTEKASLWRKSIVGRARTDPLAADKAPGAPQRRMQSHDPRNATDAPRGIFMPDAPYRLKWDFMMILLVFYYALAIPVQMAFINEDADLPTTIFEIVATVIFCFDMWVNTRTAFKEDGILQIDPKVIRNAYFQSWFVVDLVSCLPIELASGSSEGGSSTFKVNKLLRLLRVFKLFRVFRLARILQRVEEVTKFNPSILRLVRLLFFMVLVWHWIACLYWFVSWLENFTADMPVWVGQFEREGSVNMWVPPVELWCDHDWFAKGKCPQLQGCFEDGSCPKTVSEKYMNSFFWAVGITVGIGRDIMPVTLVEHLFSTLMIIVGVVLYAVVIGAASSVLANLDSHKATQRHKMDAIKRYLSQNRVQTSLSKRIRDYYEYVWSSSQTTDKNESVVFDLHDSLRLELDIHLHRRLLQSIPMFACIDDPNCIIDMIQKMQASIFIPGEYIVVEDEVGDEMYVIVRGACRVVVGLPPDPQELVARLADGDVFGEHGLINTTSRTASVVANTYCDVLVLTRDNFLNVFTKYPVFLEVSRVPEHGGFGVAFKELFRVKHRQPAPVRGGGVLVVECCGGVCYLRV
jgi:CRP-like cAMP-binding protein